MNSSVAAQAHSSFVFAADKNNGGAAGFILPLIVLAVVVVMFTRTRRNKNRAATMTQTLLQPGSEIVTRSGMLGVVVDATPDEVTIEIAPGVHIKMLPAAILDRNAVTGRGRGRGGRRSDAADEPETTDAAAETVPETPVSS